MVKQKGFPPIICLVLMLFLQSNSCTSCSGIPSDFDSVVLRASATKITAGQMITITATVPRDTTGAGVSWAFAVGTGMPANPGTFSVTSVTAATYTAPSTAPTEFTVVITATSLSATIVPPEVNSITITIEPPPPLKIKLAALPNGTIGVAYPAASLQATGGVPPYTWMLTSAASTFPTNLSLNTDGSITGMPTAPGVFNTFTVQVSDSEAPPMTATSTAGQLSITITNLLNGNYAFEFNGFNSGGAVVLAGSFNANGAGAISGGVEDVDSIQNGPKNQSFTGTYTIGSDNRGQLVFSSLAGSPTYDFAIDGHGLHGRFIEADSTGVNGSGELVQQNTTTCGSQTMSGAGPVGADFAMGLAGAEGSFTGTTPGPFAVAGRFTAEVPASSSTPGTIDNGEYDANVPGSQPFLSTSFSGTFQTSPLPARCSMLMNATTALTSMNFSVYPITTTGGLLTEAFVVETDTLSATAPFVSAGKLVHQTGYPFNAAIQSFTNGGMSVGGLTGAVIPSGKNAYVPFAAVAELQTTGGNAFTLSLVENLAGTVGSALGPSAIATSFNTNDSFGRVDTLLAQPVAPVFYVINSNEAFCLLENTNSPVLGIIEPQSKGGGATFSASTAPGSLVQGTSMPAASTVQSFSGIMTQTSTTATAGTVSGTEDTPTALAVAPNITGTYALTTSGPTDGSAALVLTQASPPPPYSGAFFYVSPTKVVMITTSDANPALVIIGDQADDFGVN
jgi:hypothetical protein